MKNEPVRQIMKEENDTLPNTSKTFAKKHYRERRMSDLGSIHTRYSTSRICCLQ
jgi:hypothetical protein